MVLSMPFEWGLIWLKVGVFPIFYLLMTPFFRCDASRLVLEDNYFGGVLPNSIVNLSSQLKSLLIGGNRTYGSIPIGVENLANIRILGIGSNALVGTIPSGIGKLKSLQLLVLSKNRITGQIPPSLCSITIITIYKAITQNFGELSKFTSIEPFSE